MSGMIQSLNVSVACAVSLYEAFRQRCTEGAGAAGAWQKLSEAEVRQLFDEWMKK